MICQDAGNHSPSQTTSIEDRIVTCSGEYVFWITPFQVISQINPLDPWVRAEMNTRKGLLPKKHRSVTFLRRYLNCSALGFDVMKKCFTTIVRLRSAVMTQRMLFGRSPGNGDFGDRRRTTGWPSPLHANPAIST